MGKSIRLCVSSRTRLYQMGISANWGEIEPIMDVYGYVGGNWQLLLPLRALTFHTHS
ncbi:DUF6934 family protein [Parapedobacter sp. DT-150]|uniref:DUF6934 family protein n=1 Tax=Parapedobacter sp. DT-150 TaxID=3396162 RepID=UPI003F1CD2F3